MQEIEKYQQEFILFQKELKSFIYRIVPHKQEAEDIAQNSYLKAFNNIDSYKKKASFKTWVFSIAVNLAKDSFRAKQRWGENWQDLGKEFIQENEHIIQEKIAASHTSEHGKFVIREHINFCFTCINKTLPLTNQICLLLKEIYNFKVREIVMITGFSEGKVKHAIADARKDMVRIFKNRCALINKKGVCHQCTELNNGFNPDQDVQIEVNKLKIAREAQNQSHAHLLELRLQLVKSIDPLHAEGTDLHNFILNNCPDWAKSQMQKETSKVK